MDVVHKVMQTISDENLLAQDDTIVVAVSGGPDSTALLHVLHELASHWNLQLIIAHLNHQFRGKESEQEAEQVAQLASELGWPCEIGASNVTDYMRAHSLSAQVASRDKRYEYLLQVADRYHADKIAMGHHADDQAETVLMRMIRGTGPTGLSGIPIRRREQDVTIIRPLLHCYKAELLAYCKDRDINFSIDSSNKERVYTRNQMRLDAMPYLQQWNKQLPQALNKLAAMMSEEDRFMEQETAKKYAEIVKSDADQAIFSKKDFLSLPIALQRRLIKLILYYLCLEEDANDFTKIDIIRDAFNQTKTPSMTLHLGDDHTLTMEYDLIRIGKKQDGDVKDYTYLVTTFPTRQHIPEAQVSITMKVEQVMDDGKHYSLQNGVRNEVMFDLNRIALPLTIRNRRPGDRMKVYGLKGTKKVKDIFIDDKIPPSRRKWIPIVVDADERLLWIPGIRHGEYAVVTENTVQVLHMSFEHYI